jgi:hypothetical protein
VKKKIENLSQDRYAGLPVMGYMQLGEHNRSSLYNFTVNITIPVKRGKEELQERQ